MSYASNATSAYTAASQMVTSLQAVVMLYDGVIKAVRQARSAIEAGRIEERFHATQKASKIVLGLQSALDFERGGDVAPMLDEFYTRVFSRLQQINFSNSIHLCDDLIAALTDVRDSWRQVSRQEETNAKGGEAQAGDHSAVKEAIALSV